MAKIIGTAIAPIDDLSYFRGNAKKHDIGKIIESILFYGFFQTLLVDKRTNQVLGGNGRLESLVWLRQNPSDAENIARELREKYGADTKIEYPPAGITLKNGDWFVNVLEIETISDEEAIAINLQDNLSVLDGGDFTLLDKSRAFEIDALLAQLETLGESNYLPVSVDHNDLESLLAVLEANQRESLEFDDFDEDQPDDAPQAEGDRYPLALALDKELWEDWISFKERIKIKEDLTAFSRLLGMVNDG